MVLKCRPLAEGVGCLRGVDAGGEAPRLRMPGRMGGEGEVSEQSLPKIRSWVAAGKKSSQWHLMTFLNEYGCRKNWCKSHVLNKKITRITLCSNGKQIHLAPGGRHPSASSPRGLLQYCPEPMCLNTD